MEYILNTLQLSGGTRVLVALLIIALITILVAWLSTMLLKGVATRLVRKTKSDLDDQLLSAAKRYVHYLIYLTGSIILFNYLQKQWEAELGPGVFTVIDGITYGLVVLVVAALVVRIVVISVRHAATRLVAKADGPTLDEFVPLIHRVTTVIVYSIAAVTILEHFGVDVKGLIAVLGVGSLAVALAAQETLANVIGGFVLMVDRPVRLGDWIRMSDGTVATVQQIGLRSTRLMTLENTLIIVPNAELVKSSIHNLSYPELDTTTRIQLGVAYDSDITKVREIMLDVVRSYPKVLADPEPTFRFADFGESALVVRVFFNLRDHNQRYEAESDLRSIILERFRAAGISIPFPQLVIHTAPHDRHMQKKEPA